MQPDIPQGMGLQRRGKAVGQEGSGVPQLRSKPHLHPPNAKRNNDGRRLANTPKLPSFICLRSQHRSVAIALRTTGGFCSTIWTTDLCKSPRQKKSLWRHMTTEKE